MSASDQSTPTPPKRGWISRLFKWIDSFESESQRKIIQGVIQGLILATIIAFITFIWKEHGVIGDAIAGGGKSVVGLFQQSVKIQLWVGTLICGIISSLLGTLYGFHVKNRIKNELMFAPSDFAQKHKLADGQLVKVKTNMVYYAIEYETRFMAVEFINDEKRTKGLQTIVSKGYGSIHSAADLIIITKTFREFIEKMGMVLAINDTANIISPETHVAASSFSVASRENIHGEEMAHFKIGQYTGKHKKILTMNQVAFNHFDWAYTSFRKQNKLDKIKPTITPTVIPTEKTKVQRFKDYCANHKIFAPIIIAVLLVAAIAGLVASINTIKTAKYWFVSDAPTKIVITNQSGLYQSQTITNFDGKKFELNFEPLPHSLEMTFLLLPGTRATPTDYGFMLNRGLADNYVHIEGKMVYLNHALGTNLTVTVDYFTK